MGHIARLSIKTRVHSCWAKLNLYIYVYIQQCLTRFRATDTEMIATLVYSDG